MDLPHMIDREAVILMDPFQACGLNPDLAINVSSTAFYFYRRDQTADLGAVPDHHLGGPGRAFGRARRQPCPLHRQVRNRERHQW